MNAMLDGTDDYFDSRDVIERIEELVRDLQTDDDGELILDTLDDDDREEYAALVALRDEADGYVADFLYGETFIADDYFEDYARELASDIGAVNADAGWPNSFIDWKAAADALKMDYTSFEFRDTTYWAR